MIRWIERTSELHEARATLPDGREVYLGYVAVSPGAAAWRGYVGRGFAPVGMGPREAVRAAVERRATGALERLADAARGEGGGAESHAP